MKIVLLQRVLPAYREPLFESLRSQAQAADHDFDLWVSPASVSFARRGTEGRLPWMRTLPVKSLPAWLGGLAWQSLPWREVLAADVVIVPDSARCLSNGAALLLRRLFGKPVLTWGHGANFQPDWLSRSMAALRYRYLRLAGGQLVYTESCVAPLVAAGFDRTRIAVTENAIDASAAVGLHPQHPEVLDFRARHDLGDDPCVVFLGGWYARKRPELVVQLGQALRERVPQARVLVIGGGDGLAVLKAQRLHWLTLLGPLHGRDKFVALSAARCLAVSGAAGLNLLDAMTVGLPVVLPQRPDHGPEVAYVQQRMNGLVVADDVAQMAEACKLLLLDAGLQSNLSAGARQTAERLTVRNMATNILNCAMQAACGFQLKEIEMKMKIIHVASSHQVGLTNQETQLALAYKKILEIDSLVVTGECEQYEGCFKLLEENGILNKIIKGFDIHFDFYRLVKEFSSVIKEFKPDIVTVNTNWQLVIVGFAKFFSGSKFSVVYTIHGFRHNSRLKSFFARYLIGTILLLLADAINAPSVYVKKKFSIVNRKIKIIPLGEDAIFFENSASPSFSKPLNFIFPAVFRDGKNQAMLISAFSDYLNISKDMEGKLFLPGEGELRKNAENLASDLGIASRVVFPGQLNRQEMLAMYLQCQVAIIPSNSETFGHCIAEPLVMKRIVVSRNIGLAPDFLVNKKNGFLFDGRHELVQRMLGIHAMSEVELLKISEAAGATGENFRWKNIALRNYKELFAPLLENS